MSDCKDALLKHEMTCQEKNGKRFNDLETEIKLTNQNFKYMEKELTEIKDLVKNGFENINEKIEWLDDKYATKESVSRIDKILWTFWVAIILWMWGFIWSLIANLLWV